MGRHLVDTNVLLRWAQPHHPQYGAFNDGDFVRYPQITAVHQGAVTAVERDEE